MGDEGLERHEGRGMPRSGGGAAAVLRKQILTDESAPEEQLVRHAPAGHDLLPVHRVPPTPVLPLRGQLEEPFSRGRSCHSYG